MPRSRCAICKVDSRELKRFGQKLTVHHLDGDRENNAPKNLITLCPSCHKREEWRIISDIWNDVEREVREMYEAHVKKRGWTMTQAKRATVRSLKQDKRRQRRPEEYLTEEEIAEIWAYNRLDGDPDDPDALIYLEFLRPLEGLSQKRYMPQK